MDNEKFDELRKWLLSDKNSGIIDVRTTLAEVSDISIECEVMSKVLIDAIEKKGYTFEFASYWTDESMVCYFNEA